MKRNQMCQYAPSGAKVGLLITVVALASCGPAANNGGGSNAAPALVEATPNRFAEISYPNAYRGEWGGAESIYAQSCGYCHDSHVAPEILGVEWDVESITTIVRNGRLGMPAFRETDISDAELLDLAQWLEVSEEPKGTKP